MICHDLSTSWKSLGKKVLFWVKESVSWARNAQYMVHIAYHTESILPFAIMRKNNANVKIANTRQRKLLWLFLPSPKGCQLLPPWSEYILCPLSRLSIESIMPATNLPQNSCHSQRLDICHRLKYVWPYYESMLFSKSMPLPNTHPHIVQCHTSYLSRAPRAAPV